jgi:hypothetical protein
MTKIIYAALLSLLLTGAVSADSGPVWINPDEDVTPFEPVLMPGWSDLVAWTQVGDAITGFRRAASGVLGNYFYSFGTQYSTVAQALNLTTNQWEASTPPPLGNCNWHGVTVTSQNAIYIVGRYVGGYWPEIQKFTPTGGGPTGIWTVVAPYPVSTCGAAAAWDGGNFIYAAGGAASVGSLTSAYRYDLTLDTWTAIANLPSGQRYCGGAFVAGKFIVIGGIDTPTLTQLYNPATNSWTTGAPIPYSANFATFGTTFNENYVFSIGNGGHASTWPATNAVASYDPIANTWMLETPLPGAYGCNSARYIGNGGAVSAGGNSGTGADVTITYRGVGFPGGVLPTIDITVTAVNPPIVIPANGGTFQYRANIRNTTAQVQTFMGWTKWLNPLGVWSNLLGPFSLTLPGSANVTRRRFQNVAGSNPPGTYTFVGYTGPNATTIWDSSFFTFTKSATDMGGEWVYNNDNWGEDFDMEIESTPSQFALLGNFPNPFNPTTTIRFSLAAAGYVTLTVYDLQGREVAALMDGYRTAGAQEVAFDATALPSGVYAYRLTSSGQTAIAKMVLMK